MRDDPATEKASPRHCGASAGRRVSGRFVWHDILDRGVKAAVSQTQTQRIAGNQVVDAVHQVAPGSKDQRVAALQGRLWIQRCKARVQRRKAGGALVKLAAHGGVKASGKPFNSLPGRAQILAGQAQAQASLQGAKLRFLAQKLLALCPVQAPCKGEQPVVISVDAAQRRKPA